MNVVLALYIFLGLNVPIGAYNNPGYSWQGDYSWRTFDDWPPFYRDMLDSAVSCGLGYFKPGWLARVWEIIDTTAWITSEYPLTQVFISYPPSGDEYNEPSEWEAWWDSAATKYCSSDSPNIVNPVKHWEISLLVRKNLQNLGIAVDKIVEV